jgi:hypothetical protein
LRLDKRVKRAQLRVVEPIGSGWQLKFEVWNDNVPKGFPDEFRAEVRRLIVFEHHELRGCIARVCLT